MGERLLAQRIMRLLRDQNGRQSKAGTVLLDWASDQRAWLWPERSWPDGSDPAAPSVNWDLLPQLLDEIETDDSEPAPLACVRAVACLLDFNSFDREATTIAAALARLPRLAVLRSALCGAGEDIVAIVAILSGAEPGDAAARLRRSAPLKLGLLEPNSGAAGGVDLNLTWKFSQLISEGAVDEAHVIGALLGVRQEPRLEREDFAEQGQAFDLVVRLLRGAVGTGATGVNVLIHGPPGTGKTEFARTAAAEAGFALFAVGEFDDEGEEPSRYERLHALQRAQRLLGRRRDSVLLFDEMEDLLADASMVVGGGRRAGSKIFVNRLLEEAKVPTIWTSNAMDAVDPAHLRRMSFVLRMDYPGPATRARIAARVAEVEGAGEGLRGLDALLPVEREAGAVARAALRSARLAGGGSKDAEAAARSLVEALRGGRSIAPTVGDDGLDLDLYDRQAGVSQLVQRLTASGAPPDFSVLLTGPPGTGKTALAAHLAQRLDRRLAVKRASDLLSKWVGETEANIAQAFAEAREQGAVLLFDEADSLLLDRQDAQRSWEITQVNELLTWMDSHPLPFIAATNYARRLDPAALRRFVFKIELKAMEAEAAEQAFQRFFGLESPAELRNVGGLTPGDFAVVKRQLRYRPGTGAAEIVRLLAAEVEAKPERPARIGF